MTLFEPAKSPETAPPRGSLALLSLLYFAQGLPFGFQATALPVYLRSRGTSLSALGFVGLLSLPWLLKALWAPWVDRFGSDRFGRRKSWIVPLQLALVLCAWGASGAAGRGENLPLLGWIAAMNLFAATQDIAVDGWAVELLKGRSLGPGNAIQVVGYKAGMLTGGGLLIWASGSWGWSALFLWMGALWLLIGAVTFAFPERSPVKTELEMAEPSRRSVRAMLETLWAAFRLPGAGGFLLLIATYKLGESMADAMFKPFLVDRGVTVPTIGLWLGTYGMAASLLGSALGGYWVARSTPLCALRGRRSYAACRCWPRPPFPLSRCGRRKS